MNRTTKTEISWMPRWWNRVWKRPPLATLGRFLVLSFVLHLIWETLQIPFYTIWGEGTGGEIIFAILHCTLGDVMIGAASLVIAVLVGGGFAWPQKHYLRVAVLAMIGGFSYTIYSEWLNTEFRGAWAYAEIMPLVPPFGTGITPLMQWLVVPAAVFWLCRPGSSFFSRSEPADRRIKAGAPRRRP